MVKLAFTYGTQPKEGFELCVPTVTTHLKDESVDEIVGDYVIEKVPNLILFIEECYRILRPGGKAVFTSPNAASSTAWISPLTVRGICESTLNFSSKDWREQYKFTDYTMRADFEVTGQFVVDQEALARSDEAKNFWLKRYMNVAQGIIFTLTKK